MLHDLRYFNNMNIMSMKVVLACGHIKNLIIYQNKKSELLVLIYNIFTHIQ